MSIYSWSGVTYLLRPIYYLKKYQKPNAKRKNGERETDLYIVYITL